MSDGRRGFTVWLTGLSGAGKSTIGSALAAELELRGPRVEVLDGDVVRAHLSRGLGFSREDRDTNVERIGWVASRLTRHGAAVVVAAISPYAETRARARAMVEAHGSFIEVWVEAAVEECARRDVKGLYAKALAGRDRSVHGSQRPLRADRSPRGDRAHGAPDARPEPPRGSRVLEQRALIVRSEAAPSRTLEPVALCDGSV